MQNNQHVANFFTCITNKRKALKLFKAKFNVRSLARYKESQCPRTYLDKRLLPKGGLKSESAG